QCRIEGVELPIPLSILRSKKWQRRQLIQRIGWMLLTGGVAAGGYGLYKRYALKVFSCEVVKVNAKGEEIERKTHRVKYFTEKLADGVTLDLVYIPKGTFMMGTEASEIERLNQKYNVDYFSRESPQHEVTVPSFYMAKFPITQKQWQAIATQTDLKGERDLEPEPSHFKGDNRPVEQVTWHDAVEFCQRLSKLTGNEYKLPSEAQWEYGCRARTTTPFYFGETITGELANYDASETYAEESKGRYRGETTPVGSFPANAFGLYDLHGNVWEWCEDTWHDNYEGAPIDGSAWVDENDNDNHSRMLRGGSWSYYPWNCRAAIRLNHVPGYDNSNIGFRVVVLRRT
ncbi:MAG: formylglycine-generating enzyme family protein, partial [Microcystaceae cyanobacterium]